MKLATLATLALMSSALMAADRVEYRGRIVEAAQCSQSKDSGYFTTAKERALKCKKIRLPGNDVCDATVTGPQRPSKMVLEVPGLTNHKGTKRGLITFTKGGVIVYESKQRTGAFSIKPGIFSKEKMGDQMEFKLSASRGQYELSKVALYLDHKTSGSRVSWTEYTCDF